MRFVLIPVIAVLIAACGSPQRAPDSQPQYQAGLNNAKRIQATQLRARESQFLNELRAASTAEHAGQANETVISKAKTSMAALTGNPTSVLFRNVLINKTQGFSIVCGEINAKSAAGEYLGFRRFYWVNNYLSAIRLPDSPENSFKDYQASVDTMTACPDQ